MVDFPMRLNSLNSIFTEEEIFLRKKIYLALKLLNKKGPKDGKNTKE